MPTYEQLYHLNLGKLDAAVSDWGATAKKFRSLQTSFGDQVETPFRAAGWTGPAATVSAVKKQLAEAKKEYEDAEAEAKGVHGVLKNLHTELKKAQDDLRQVADVEAKQQGFKVSGTGTVTPVHDLSRDQAALHDPDGQDAIRKQRNECDALVKRLEHILQRAAEADETACWALRRNAGSTKGDFNAKVVTSLDQADSIRALTLAKKGSDMSDKEIAQLNELLSANKGDKEFAQRFASGLGGKGTLDLWTEMTDPHAVGGPLSEERKKVLEELQKDLGTTLSLATHPSGDPSLDHAMNAWKREVVKLGPEYIDTGNVSTPRGFQVMSNLMRHGTYEAGFLQDYGKALLDHEKQFNGKGPDSLDSLWTVGPRNAPFLNFGAENDQGNDPMTGFMEALGHNPRASTQFFSDDGNFEYLTGGAADGRTDNPSKGRDWPTDASFHGDPEKIAGYNSLGHALEAATLGVPFGSESTDIHRSESTAEVMRQVINAYGGNPELMNGQYGINDSIGRMGAGYIDDLNYSSCNFGQSGDLYDRDQLFGQGRHDFGGPATADFLRTLGQDKETYEVMSSAQQVYTASGIESHDNQVDALAAAENGARMHGLLDEARSEQIGKDFTEDKEAKNRELEKQAEWRKFGVGAVVAGGVAVATGPAAVAAYPVVVPLVEQVGEAAKAGSGNQIGDWLKASEYDNTQQANQGQRAFDSAGQNNAMLPALNYIESTEMSREERREALGRIQTAYNNGRTGNDTDNNRGW